MALELDHLFSDSSRVDYTHVVIGDQVIELDEDGKGEVEIDGRTLHIQRAICDD